MKKMKRYDGEEGSMVGDYDSGKGAGAAGTFETISPSAKKQRVVTKEELAKTGLSLRDFLNKERGLTRRGESAPMPPSAPAEVAQTSAPATATSSSSEKTANIGDIASKMSRQADANRAAMEAAKPAPAPRKRNILEEARENVRRGNVARSSMASGGAVSASRRADGIAQRGKTRGKMC